MAAGNYVGSNPSTGFLLTSPDAVHWTLLPTSGANLYGLAYGVVAGVGTYVAVGGNRERMLPGPEERSARLTEAAASYRDRSSRHLKACVLMASGALHVFVCALIFAMPGGPTAREPQPEGPSRSRSEEVSASGGSSVPTAIDWFPGHEGASAADGEGEEAAAGSDSSASRADQGRVVPPPPRVEAAKSVSSSFRLRLLSSRPSGAPPGGRPGRRSNERGREEQQEGIPEVPWPACPTASAATAQTSPSLARATPRPTFTILRPFIPRWLAE